MYYAGFWRNLRKATTFRTKRIRHGDMAPHPHMLRSGARRESRPTSWASLLLPVLFTAIGMHFGLANAVKVPAPFIVIISMALFLVFGARAVSANASWAARWIPAAICLAHGVYGVLWFFL